MHKLFEKQLARAHRDPDHLDLQMLGELVSTAYEEADRDRQRTDRSMHLMIEELDQLNRHLEQLVEQRTSELVESKGKLQEQNLRFDAAISNMPCGVVMFDAEARLVICIDATRTCTHCRMRFASQEFCCAKSPSTA